MPADYIAQLLPEPFVILGRELRPLSIGHLLWLDRLECDPVDDEEKLITAVLVCSLPVEEVIPALQDKWLLLKVRLWRWRLGKVDFEDKVRLFNDYVTDHTRAPSVIQKHSTESDNTSGTPFLQHLKVTLQAKLNYSPSEAINCPFGQALFDYYVFHELEGNIEVCDRDRRSAARERADVMHDAWIKAATENNGKVVEDGA